MSERSMLSGLLALVAAGGACLSAGTASAAELKIGVVNVDEIIARYKKAEDLRRAEEEKFKDRQQKIATRSRGFNKRLGELQADPAASGGESKKDGKRKLARELEVEKFMLELDVREFRRDKQRAADRIRREIADEVVAVCRRLGRAEGYDLILKRSEPGAGQLGEGDDDRGALSAFERNPVLFAAASVDITSRALEVLEDAYRRGVKLVPERTEIERPGPPFGTADERR